MKDGSKSNKAVNSITVNNLQEDDGISEIVVSLDLTSKEKRSSVNNLTEKIIHLLIGQLC